jgi:hypothetical protein
MEMAFGKIKKDKSILANGKPTKPTDMVSIRLKKVIIKVQPNIYISG